MTDVFQDMDQLMDQLINPRLGRPMHWDRAGRPITMRQWAELNACGLRYKRVAQDTVRGGRRRVWISTVWLGSDSNFASGGTFGGMGTHIPIIFETMVFGGPEGIDQQQWRWSTERGALRGHWIIRREVRRALQRANGPAPLAINRPRDEISLFDEPELPPFDFPDAPYAPYGGQYASNGMYMQQELRYSGEHMTNMTGVATTCTCTHSPMLDHEESLKGDDGVILKCRVAPCTCQFIVNREAWDYWKPPPGWRPPDDDL